MKDKCCNTPTRHWITLRLTALLNVPLVLWLVYSIVSLIGADYYQFTGWLKQPVNAGLMIILIVSVFYHAALGCHEIIEDYVSDEKTKAASLRLKALAFLVAGAVCVGAVVKVVLG